MTPNTEIHSLLQDLADLGEEQNLGPVMVERVKRASEGLGSEAILERAKDSVWTLLFNIKNNAPGVYTIEDVEHRLKFLHDEILSSVPSTREDKMVVLRRDAEGTPTVWCDPEIADIVKALNDGGVATRASCSGHGERNGSILLRDGRELIIAASAPPALDTAARVQHPQAASADRFSTDEPSPVRTSPERK